MSQMIGCQWYLCVLFSPWTVTTSYVCYFVQNTGCCEARAVWQLDYITGLCLQVESDGMKQAFTEAWGKKAKENFSPTVLATFNTTLQRRLKKINILGAANLPAGERNEVSLLLSTSYQMSQTQMWCIM